MEQKTLFRTRDRMLGGVCGGIAQFFGIDKSIVRFVFFGLIAAGFFSFFVYILLWIIVPLEA